MNNGEQSLYIDVTCYSCGKLMSLPNAFQINDKYFCMGCASEYDCPTCDKKTRIAGLKDHLSMKEARISGMCQVCQDEVFD